MLKVGLIGYRNHAAVISKLVEKSGFARIERVFHPTKTLSHPCATNDFSSLLNCDAVFILSPNHTHVDYLSGLGGERQPYVFCEKPPAVDKDSLARLNAMNLRRDRTYFNFNLRRSAFAKFLGDAIEAGRLGTLVAARAQVSHGLALRPGFGGSWRAGSAIMTNVGIHFVDLFTRFFGAPVETFGRAWSTSGAGDGADTAFIAMNYARGGAGYVLVSYAAPYSYEIAVFGTEQTITYRDGVIESRGPRETFDSEGRFTTPPVLLSETVAVREMQQASMAQSVVYFLTHARDETPLPVAEFDSSIASNEILLNAMT